MKEENLRSIVIRFYLFQFLSGFHFFSAVLVPFFTVWGGVSLAVAQGLQSWFTFSIFLLEVPTGAIADRIGRKYSIALGSLAAVFATLVYGSYPNLILFVIGEFLFALGVALISGADSALLYDSLLLGGKADKASKIIGKGRSIHLLGIMAAAPLGGLMAKTWGMNSPMLLTAVPALFAFAVALTIPEVRVRKENGKEKQEENVILLIREGFRELQSNRSLFVWTIDATIVAASAYFVLWLYQPLMQKLAIPIEYFGWGHLGLVVAEIIISTNFKRITDFFGSTEKFVYFAAIATAVGFLAASVYPSPITLLSLLFLSGGLGLTRVELMMIEMNRFIASEKRATTLSFISMFRRITLAFLNPFVGLTTDYSLQYSLFLVGLIPLPVILWPLYKILKNTPAGNSK